METAVRMLQAGSRTQVGRLREGADAGGKAAERFPCGICSLHLHGST